MPYPGNVITESSQPFFLQYYVLLCFLQKFRRISRYLISKILTNQEPTRIQPGSNQDPTRNQPGSNQEPTRNQPGSNQDPTRIQPGSNQEPTRTDLFTAAQEQTIKTTVRKHDDLYKHECLCVHVNV